MKKILLITLIIVLSFWTMRPLFHSGFFPVHDNAQPSRVFEIFQSVKDGMLPVRWTKDFGYTYGYPLFNFYAPLIYYIGAFFMIFGFNVLVASKIMIGVGIIISGISMFLFAKEFWGKTGAFISAVAYMYAPYHAVDIYVRGDISESFAYAFIPLAFLGFYKIIEKNITYKDKSIKMQRRNHWFWIVIASLSLTAIILSHNLSALMVMPFLIIYTCTFLLLSKNKLSNFYSFSFTLIISLSVAAFYWIPVFAEMKYTNVLSQ